MGSGEASRTRRARTALHPFLAVLLSAAFLVTHPAAAQDKPAADEKPITEREPNAVDVAATPVEDLGIKKEEIPALLIYAESHPYDLTGITTCAHIANAVTQLNAVLGDDLDIPQTASGMSAGRVAQSVVGNFIPFRGIIRELSGANAHERAFEAAVYAGSIRRGFLKGIGQERGCLYPARPASPALASRIIASDPKRTARAPKGVRRQLKRAPARAPRVEAPRAAPPPRDRTRYTSQPVVEPIR